LAEQIKTTVEIMDGDLYIVISGCMVEMIGDDITSVVKEFSGGPLPVLAVPTPSFKGNSCHGYDLVLEALAREYATPGARKKERSVNILGLIPGKDVFYKGNLKEIKRVLELIGITANTLIGEGETLADIKNSGGAALNIVLSDVDAPLSAEAYRQVHGIPYIRTNLPIGYLQTEKFLRLVAAHFGIENETVKAALYPEREIYFNYLERVADSYNDFDWQRYGVVVADVNYAPALTEFIADELGWLPQLTVVTDPLDEEQQTAVDRRFSTYLSGARAKVRYDANAAAVRRYLIDSWERDRNHRYYDALNSVVIFGSVFEKDLAEEFQYQLLPLSFPVTNRVVFNRSYAGINGGLTLAEDAFALLVAGR
jgi:nitrogenase molybdenum-iron protein beta chain